MTTRKLAIIVFAIATLGVISGCYAQKTEEKKARAIEGERAIVPEQDGISDQQVLSFNLEGFSETGKKQWEIEGESADIVDEKVNLNNIIAKAYNEKSTVTLTADTGVYDRASKNIKLAKNVVATTDDGARLTADELQWAQDKETITTDGPVALEKDGIRTTGTGAMATPKLKQVELKENVKVEMQPATVITCEGPLEFDYENAVAVFNQNVAIKDDRGEIYADKITAYMDKVDKKIREVVAEGNVRIVRGQSSTYSDKATYVAVNGKIVLNGKPKLVIYPEKGVEMPNMFGK